MAKAPYYIIITRKDQVMLNFLKVRVVVNNHEIYPLPDSEPIVIPVEKDCPKIVITDGFHISKPVELVFKEPSYFNFDVVCAIDDFQLIVASAMLVVFYLLGFLTNVFAFKVASFVPIVWFLVYYYFNRKDFLRVRQSR
ncbi:MAG: hypothetical protein ABIR18_00455 [Chitinophagaceae bacterium]